VNLVCWQVFFGIDSIDGAFRYANRAVDALVRVNGEEVGAFAKAVNRADIYAIGVFAADTGFRNNVGHDSLLCAKPKAVNGQYCPQKCILKQF
jgi:hypothetical protein